MRIRRVYAWKRYSNEALGVEDSGSAEERIVRAWAAVELITERRELAGVFTSRQARVTIFIGRAMAGDERVWRRRVVLVIGRRSI